MEQEFNVEFILRIETDVWIKVNDSVYLYFFDSREDWDYYEEKYGRNKGRLLSKIKPFLKGKVGGAGRYE